MKAESRTGFGWRPLRWYNNEHRDLAYTREHFNNTDDVREWRDLGYSHRYFTGEMYDMRNPIPSWFDLQYYEDLLGWKHLSWSFYKMTPGVILPTHVDIFTRFKQLYDPAPGSIRRALILLEDWQSGHFLDLGATVMHRWRAGEYAWWTEDVPHTAANCGVTDRYTLQLTGIHV